MNNAKIYKIAKLFKNTKRKYSRNEIKTILSIRSDSQFYRIKEKFESYYRVTLESFNREGIYSLSEEDREMIALPGLFLEHEEIESLIILEKLLEDLDAGILAEELNPIKEKLKNLLNDEGFDIKAILDRIKIIPIANRESEPELFKTLLSSLLSKRKVKIIYRKIGGKEEERIVSPQTLLRYRDNWYMDTWCHLRNDLRTFALNRISSIKITKEKSQIVSVKELTEYYSGSYGIYSGPSKAIARIKFTGVAAEEVSQEEWHPEQQGKWMDRNNYVLKVPYGNPSELIMDILKWGELAEIVSPKKLRQKIADKVVLLSKKYNK